MPDTLCRLAIQVLEPGGSTAVDVVLPADTAVAVLIPPAVDLALGGRRPVADPRQWHLSRVGGDRLDPSLTLRENRIRDGDMILLTIAPPPIPYRRAGDPGGVVADAGAQAPGAWLRGGVAGAAMAVAVVSAVALVWSSGAAETATHLWTAAGLAMAAATVTVLVGHSARLLSGVSGPAAVVFAAATGALAVSGAGWAPGVLLAASAACATSILLLHLASGGTTTLTALAALTGAVALAGAVWVVAALPLAAAGAVLIVVSLGALAAAPKLTVAAAGLGPSRPEIAGRRAALAHRVLTGLVTGWSAAVLLGVCAAAASPQAPTVVAALLCADVGLLMLLRQRTHVDPWRRIALGANGVAAVLAAAVITVRTVPEYAPLVCAGLVTGAGAALGPGIGAGPSNPVARRGVQVLEYLALAAVVPLAVWVAGVYGLARDMALP